MALSAVQIAKRSLVKILVYLANIYGIALDIHRDSSDDAVAKACKQVRSGPYDVSF